MARATTAAWRWATSRLSSCRRARSTRASVARAAAGSSTTSRTPWHSTRSTLSGPATSSRLDRSPWRPVTVDVVLAGPAVEGGQGVGAGVDHGDPVAELADADGQPAGAAADVEDVEPASPRRAPAPARTTPRRCGCCRVARSRGRHGRQPSRARRRSARRGEARSSKPATELARSQRRVETQSRVSVRWSGAGGSSGAPGAAVPQLAGDVLGVDSPAGLMSA